MASTPATVINPNAIAGQAGSGDAGGALAVAGGLGDTGFIGGNLNLAAGASGSGVGATTMPAEILANAVAGLFEVCWFQPLSTTACPVTTSVVSFFMANRAYRIKAISVIEATFGTSETFTFHKNTGTTAPGAGTAILTGAIAMAVSNTRVAGTLSTTVATVTLAAGDRVSFTVGGTVGSAAGVNVSMLLVPV